MNENLTATRRGGAARLPVLILATGFGLGLSPVASGTVGSLLGVLLALGLYRLPGLGWQVGAAVLLALAAVPLCEYAERFLGRKDDGRIVADEYLTFPICILGLPPEPWLLACAFVVNRVFDIAKPPPANRLQACHGGFGIVVDDVIACLYALAVNHAVWWWARRFLLE